jgi:hypothetical protein
LEKGDIVLFPRMKNRNGVQKIDLPQKIRGVHGNAMKSLPFYADLNSDFLRFMGLYVSEGCGTGQASVFCFHKSETGYMDLIEKVSKRLGLHSHRRENTSTNGAIVRVEGTLLSQFLISHFGKGAHNKRIPNWIASLPEDQLSQFVRGAWDGDGSKWALNQGRRLTGYTTVSRTLAYQMFAILVKLGYMPKLQKQKRGFSVDLHGNTALDFAGNVLKRRIAAERGKKGQRTAIDDDFYYMPIMDISTISYRGEVYNLEVDSKHCYCAPFVVHNSEGFGIEVLEAMAHGRPVVCSRSAGAQDVLRDCSAGLIVNPRDAEAIAGGIDNYKCKPISSEWGGKCAVEWSEYYLWSDIHSRYQTVWRELL